MVWRSFIVEGQNISQVFLGTSNLGLLKNVIFPIEEKGGFP